MSLRISLCVSTNNLFVMQAYNTRLFKKSLPDKSVVYELAIASAEAKPRVSHVFQSDQKSINIDVIYGDHAPFMARLADCIEKARASGLLTSPNSTTKAE